jgi:UDP-N-acetylmuramate--alanine ligase
MDEGARQLHFIGIGGAGMSGLALVLRGMGATVSGSDRAASSYTQRLLDAGVPVAIGHDVANVPDGAEIVVSTAIGDDNPELERARELGLKVLHRSDLLGQLAARRRCIAVGGTHGKTTTTAMIAHVLAGLGQDPSYFVGGEVTVGKKTTNAAWGEGDWIVVEADESDRSFLKLAPEVAVITNVELDHHATYAGGYAELCESFADFAAGAECVVIWRGQDDLASLAPPGSRTVGFAIDDGSPPAARQTIAAGDIVAREVTQPADASAGAEFTLVTGGHEFPGRLGVRGEHNVQNALAAIAALREAGVAPDEALGALASFRGVARRFELLGREPHGAVVYDDYAHHPTEVVAALATARAAAGDGRVVAVFQPHLYSRTKSLAREFGRALAAADIVIVLDVYPARELAEDFPGVSGHMVAAATADAAPGRPVYWTPSGELAGAAIDDLLRAGDLCITIGAGDVTEIGRALITQAAQVT